MTLKLEFLYDEHKSLHFAVTDGCQIEDLAQDFTSEGRLTRDQVNYVTEHDEPEGRRYLFYFNTFIVEHNYLNTGDIDLHCPKCGNDYRITKSMYREAAKHKPRD